MPNGFDFVDQLFSGVIAFVYNVAETAFRLLTCPSRAPSVLLRRWRHPATRQISGITCLALSVTGALMVMLPPVPALRIAGVDLWRLVPTPEGEVRLGTVMPFVIGGIAAAIVVDAAGRAALAALRVPAARRPAIVARLAYAFSFFPIAVALYVALFRFTPWLAWLARPGPDGQSGAELFVPLLLLVRGGWLVGTTAAHALVPAARATGRARTRRLAGAATVFVTAAAACVGAAVTTTILNRAAADARPTAAADHRSAEPHRTS